MNGYYFDYPFCRVTDVNIQVRKGLIEFSFANADVAELVDALASGVSTGNDVVVRIHSSASNTVE